MKNWATANSRTEESKSSGKQLLKINPPGKGVIMGKIHSDVSFIVTAEFQEQQML